MREGLVLKHLFSLPYSVALSQLSLWVSLTTEPGGHESRWAVGGPRDHAVRSLRVLLESLQVCAIWVPPEASPQAGHRRE
jgi:hypothetical protein